MSKVTSASLDRDKELVRETLTLTSLAMLKVDIDERHRNYIDYLVTFVLSALGTNKPEVITDTVVTKLLEKEFGLNVPIKAVQHVLRRLAREGHLRKEHETFFPSPTLPTVDFSTKRTDAANKIQRVVAALATFAPTVQSNLTWSDAESTSAILGFLARFTVDCLNTYVFNTALPHVPETGPKELYIVSRFIQNAFERDRAMFDDFIVLVKGQMYANALTCPDLESLQQKFQNVTFYLDTPILLNLLGLQGSGAKQAAGELASLIHELRGSLAVFEHTLEEVKGVIRYAVHHFDDPQSSSRVLREVRSNGIALSELLLCLDQVEERLSTHHVRVRPTPRYEETLQIDHKAFQEALEDKIRWVNENALENDINSVRSIYVLRKGNEPVRIENAGAVFVTSNAAFSKVAFDFGKSHNSTREVSSVITDYSLANVAWLKAPMKRPTLPEKETLAMCYAALEPGKELFNKYVAAMAQAKKSGRLSEQDHAVLRLSPIAYRELMDFTLGEETALTGDGIGQILDRVKQSLISEQTKLFDAERAKIVNFHTGLENERAKKELELKDSITQKQAAIGKVEAENQHLVLTASRRAKSVSRLLTFALMTLFSILLLVGACAGSGLVTSQTTDSLIYRCLFALVIVFAVGWGWYSWITGRTVRGLAEQIEHRMTLKIYSWITGQAKPHH